MVSIDTVAAPVAGLMMVTAKITNPAMTPAVFNHWYSEVHVRDMVKNNFATVALRYANYSLGQTASINSTINQNTQYLALYNVPDINFLNAPDAMSHLPLAHETFPDKTNPVTKWSQWNFTYWTPLQTFEGKNNATTRPAFALPVKIEPADGGDDELDQWYRKQHLDMLSMTPGYRRTTRWKSADGSKPRFLAVHEMDEINLTPHQSEVLMGTEWAKKVLGGAKTFDPSSYGLILEKGNLAEKLGPKQ